MGAGPLDEAGIVIVPCAAEDMHLGIPVNWGLDGAFQAFQGFKEVLLGLGGQAARA